MGPARELRARTVGVGLRVAGLRGGVLTPRVSHSPLDEQSLLLGFSPPGAFFTPSKTPRTMADQVEERNGRWYCVRPSFPCCYKSLLCFLKPNTTPFPRLLRGAGRTTRARTSGSGTGSRSTREPRRSLTAVSPAVARRTTQEGDTYNWLLGLALVTHVRPCW